MKKIAVLIISLFLTNGPIFGQSNPFEKISFVLGDWTGTGAGFGNEKSKIESSFNFVMDGKYIEVNNEGFINQYVLNDSLSNNSLLVFESEIIENFVAGGKVCWTIKKIK